MTEQREMRIPYDDLTRISIECPCGTEITIDMLKHLEEEWENKGMRCPLCGATPDSQIKSGLSHLANWLSCINESGKGGSIFFRVKAKPV